MQKSNFLIKIIIAMAITAVLSLVLANLPLNENKYSEFTSQRILDGFSAEIKKQDLNHGYKCSIVVLKESLVSTAQKIESAGILGNSKADSLDCNIALKTSGWMISAELKAKTLDPITINIPVIRWSSLLPAIFALALAIATRRLILALFTGVVLGSVLMYSDGTFTSALTGLTIGTATVFKVVLLDDFHFWIFLFTFALIGMVNVSTKSGGMTGLANIFAKLAKNSRSTQLATVFLGLAVFFDDYSNTVVVGGCMRPLSDKMKISREKLAYVVDSTAAPIAGLALISTWIGYEVGLIGESLKDIGLTQSPYTLFISTLPFRFYCILTIMFVFINIISKREFGPMFNAQNRAVTTGEVLRKDSKPLSSSNVIEPEGEPKAISALIPVLSVIFVTLSGMALNGAGIVSPWSVDVPAIFAFEFSRLFTLQNNYLVLCEDGAWVLAMASLTGSFLAFVLGVTIGKAKVFPLFKAWFSAGKMLVLAFSILILAWSIGHINSDLGTGDFLVSSLAESISPWLLPIIIFVLAAIISFSTGSSWGTMAVLLPAVVPLAYHVGGLPLMIISVGAVLDGSIFGDHCSPLSDTTIMSSIAAGCDHLDHVKTQMPYSIITALAAIFAGYAMATLINPVISYIISAIVFLMIFKYLGKAQVED